MAKSSMKPEEIIKLLSKLKAGTPDYPAELVAAKKAAFLKQAATIKINGKGRGGGSSGSGGGSGAISGGGFATRGFLWQALLGGLILSSIFLTAFLYRDQIADLSSKNEAIALVVEPPIVSNEDATLTAISTPASPIAPTSTARPSVTPNALSEAGVESSPDGTQDNQGLHLGQPPGTPAVPNGTSDNQGLHLGQTPGTPAVPNGTKDNPGLHLGQTPGTPAAPGQGNPGNVNQPDKPDNSSKPDKPDNSNKPDKPANPNKPDKPPK